MPKTKIYADNAATTRMSQTAIDTMIRYLATDYGNASQPYSFARSAKRALKEARSIIADCIGAKPNEIIFTSGGSESDNWVIKNATLNKQHITTTQIEHHAILNSCNFAEKHGANVNYMKVDNNGVVSCNDINSITGNNNLLSVMMANNEIGTVEPIADYCRIAKQHGCIFHTDAVQAVGHIHINVKELNVDFLSASGHKFNGPKGVGFLYVKDGTNINPIIHGGTQELGLRAGTENVPSIMAMAVALKENIENLEVTKLHLQRLEDIIISSLQKESIDFIRNGQQQLPGLLSLSFNGMDGESLLHRLDLIGISISTGSACDSKRTQVSHVLKAINLPLEYAKGTIRISLGKYNTTEEANKIAEALIKIIKH